MTRILIIAGLLLAACNAASDSSPLSLRAKAAPSGSCLNGPGPLVVLSGAQSKGFDSRTTAQPGWRVDAHQASWTGTTPYAIRAGNGKATSPCWSGGTITGTFPNNMTWDKYHSTAGLFMYGGGLVVENVTVSNYGDCIRIEDNTDNWSLSGFHTNGCHDDCVENDRLYSGLIDDALFEACFVFLSERPGSGVGIPVSGAGKRVTISNTAIHLKPMPTVYRGPAPGTGPLFKWSKEKQRPSAALTLGPNLVIMADQKPSNGDLNIPLATCVAPVTIIWRGGGSFPGKTPSCATITTSTTPYDSFVVAWKARHP